MREEILAQKRSSEWTAETLKNVKGLQPFIDETMRPAPTAGGHMRLSPSSVELTSQRSGKSYVLPAGTMFVYTQAQVMNDPSVVSNAHEFDLNRFSRECKRDRRGKTDAVLDSPMNDVFSSGPRQCIGSRLAKVEIRLVIAELVARYHVGFAIESLPPKYTIWNALLSRPDPVPKFVFTSV